VIARLQAHVQAGAQVYIASSVVEPIAESFARRIGVQAIGSPVNVDGGKVRLVDGLVSSERKIEEVLRRLEIERVDYAYGDTFMDIPMLENADHPVAVYSDKRLLEMAKERGWEVIA
jgi:phosphoserine phosphatase